MTATTEPPPRLISLDVIRGVAVMGIFSVNVVAFAMIEPAYLNPAAARSLGTLDIATWLANYILIDGKMRSLFSMLFGASMLLVIDRAVATGGSGASVHYRRMIVLALFGLAHFYFIWFGDILFLYAVTGMIAFLFRRQDAIKLVAASLVLFAVSVATFATFAAQVRALDVAAHSAEATRDEIRDWDAAVGGWGSITPEERFEDTRIARSGFATRAEHMLTERAFEPFTTLSIFLSETLALMLLGMACYRSGYFTGEWSDRAYRRAAAWGIGIGALGFTALGLIEIASGFYLPLILFNFLAIGTPLRVAMALGYAALIILLARNPGAIRERFAAVGRAAFSNYLGTSILAAAIFYGDGLALFERLSRFEAWLFVPLLWALMLLWSKPWLDRFAYGPLEWAWRSLARWELQPMRRRVAGAAASVEA